MTASFLTQCDKKKFNWADWKESNYITQQISSKDRIQMAEDLVRSRQLIGLNHVQMLNLLGELQNNTASTSYLLKETYNLIDPVSESYLQIDFNRDSIITKAAIEEWHKR